MNGWRKKSNKIGNIDVFIVLGIGFLVVVFTCILLGYFQLNVVTNTLRKNLFFAANNAILAMDNGELSYGMYSIDTNKAKDIIQGILDTTYKDNSFIKDININDISFENTNKPKLKFKVKIKLIPIIKIQGKEEYIINIQEEVKISLMTYGRESGRSE